MKIAQSGAARLSGTAAAASAAIATGSYIISQFAVDAEGEIQRLNAQVDLFWKQELALYQRLGLKDGLALLDCGCGPGHLLDKLHALYPALQSTGVEIDGQLVAVARQTAACKNGCRIFQQSINALELPDNSYDFVIARLVFEHLPDPLPALREVFRVLKPGGKAVLIDNDFDLHERTWPDSPALVELYGAYRTARRLDGGNPCIGRQLPGLLKRAGFTGVDLEILAAHNHTVGDSPFLKAEGSGIPAQLVKNGHLPADSLDRIARQWHSMLTNPEHAIFRMLFAAIGEKPSADSLPVPTPGSERTKIETGPSTAASDAFTDLNSADKVAGFIQHIVAEDMKVPIDSIALDASLIHQGADSMVAMTLCGKLESRLGIALSIAEVLSDRSVNDLAQKVLSLAKTGARPLQ
ncbi:MAG: methyltransferase domain-containing protein [Verrucomicrobiota bacterium]